MRINWMTTLAAAALFTGAVGTPAQAQMAMYGWQPVVGPIANKELQMEQELVAAYNSGMLSPQEYAEQKRDLDGMLCQVEEYRSLEQGMIPWAEKKSLAFLQRLDKEFSAHYAERKSAVVHK